VFIAAHLMVGPLIPGATDSPPRRPWPLMQPSHLDHENAPRQTAQPPTVKEHPAMPETATSTVTALPKAPAPDRPHAAAILSWQPRPACL
jgi:hypothetical protein